MPYDLRYNDALRAIELVFNGILSAEDLRKCTSEGIDLQNERHVYAVLINALDLESAPSIMEVYDLPRQYEERGFRKANRLALVWPKVPAARHIAVFYDTVCNNRGWKVQPFDARDEAVAWLTSNGPS